jgi:hypothetical protein
LVGMNETASDERVGIYMPRHAVAAITVAGCGMMRTPPVLVLVTPPCSQFRLVATGAAGLAAQKEDDGF